MSKGPRKCLWTSSKEQRTRENASLTEEVKVALTASEIKDRTIRSGLTILTPSWMKLSLLDQAGQKIASKKEKGSVRVQYRRIIRLIEYYRCTVTPRCFEGICHLQRPQNQRTSTS